MHDQVGIDFELILKNQALPERDAQGNTQYRFWGGLCARTAGRGVGLIRAYETKACKIPQISCFFNCQVVSLVLEDNNEETTSNSKSVYAKKKVAGVYLKNGKKVRSKSVILACGGFEANETLRKQHLGEHWDAENVVVRGTRHNSGDFLTICQNANVQKFGNFAGCHAVGTDFASPSHGNHSKPGDIYKKHSYPYGLLINLDGVRFVDEGADFRNYTYAANGRELLKQPHGIAVQIFDSKTHHLLRDEYSRPETTSVGPTDSIEELASELKSFFNPHNFNTQNFLKTVDQYNEKCDKANAHEKFSPNIKDNLSSSPKGQPKKSNWALPIDSPPFYAFPIRCGITFTYGGLRINQNAQVLNEKGEIVKNLLAAGELVGGLFHDNYPGGSGLMSGSVFGCLAGKNSML